MTSSKTHRAADKLTLAIDIGGSHLKAGVLDANGTLVAGPVRVATPTPATPRQVLDALMAMIRPLGSFHRVSVGFPGVVRNGMVLTAPNLGTKQWRNFPLGPTLSEQLGKPVRLLNDASMQGLGVIVGKGLECVLTLGTGMGFALFRQGHLMPHMEMGQHIARGDATYDQYVGDAALRDIGRKPWNKRMRKVVDAMQTLLNYDTLYIGGGNARHIDFDLPANVHIVSNQAGVTGGARLWDPIMDELFPMPKAAHAEETTSTT
jgi:polyphosphate glucokinase